MREDGDVVSVGALRRALAALPDDEPVVVGVEDGYGRRTGADSVEVCAGAPRWRNAWIEVRVAETLSWDDPYVGENPLASAWAQVVERGQCPASMLAKMVAGLLCGDGAPGGCRSFGCPGCVAADGDVPF